MFSTTGWFILIAAVGGLTLASGLKLGGRPYARGACTVCTWRVRVVLGLGVVALFCLAYVTRHPAVVLRVMPASWLANLEGVIALPVFCGVIGLAWSRCRLPRQRAVVAWGMALGTVYFLHAGAWMLKPVPQIGHAAPPGTHASGNGSPPSGAPSGYIFQSEDYTCVAAAAATACNLLGLPTSEWEMAQLTHTKPGVGATTVRALAGLQRRLEGTAYSATLVEVRPREVRHLPLPAITPLQFEPRPAAHGHPAGSGCERRLAGRPDGREGVVQLGRVRARLPR